MADHAAKNSGLVQLSDTLYKIIQALVEVVLPSAAVLYVALAAYWHWGYEFEVGGSIAAVTVFLGALLKLSRKGYTPSAVGNVAYDGSIIQDVTDDGKPIIRFELSPEATENVLNKEQIVFKGLDTAN